KNHYYFEKGRAFFTRSKSLLYKEKTRKSILVEIFTALDKENYINFLKAILKLHERKLEPGADINSINGEIITIQEKINEIYASYAEDILVSTVPNNYIEYFMNGNDIYVIAELGEKEEFVKLGEGLKFNELYIRLSEYILSKGYSADDSITHDMYTFLVKPIINKCPQNVVIIPDESIGYVPFEMLSYDDGSFLIESTSISYSFEYHSQSIYKSSDVKKMEIYCLAPTYKKKETKPVAVSRGSVYNLPYAQMEVDSIKALYGESAILSKSGNKESWEIDVSRAEIFHYAGHAIIGDEEAYLALNDNNDMMEQLTANEISLMYHPLNLVVLSACETGLGKLEHGEGIRSLGRSFMESGSEATVISLWNVNDKSTADLMLVFYKLLKQGLSKDESLRQSKLDFIKKAKGLYKHPYYWAAFIPAGKMSAVTTKN
ncbi:MAG TPA: CHAT domain-containing protein, partial [Saprospiraceae bacterium]|nr:CHAT domain-containing protein [Saprospiraceae bacterium]